MTPIERIQFRYRLTGADFRPKSKNWLYALILIVAMFMVGAVWS